MYTDLMQTDGIVFSI